jgi:hypothetical protein
VIQWTGSSYCIPGAAEALDRWNFIRNYKSKINNTNLQVCQIYFINVFPPPSKNEEITLHRLLFYVLFCINMKLSLWSQGKNIDSGCLRTGCLGEYLEPRKMN